MATKDYTDPRWQRLRLEVMNRDKFECQICSDKESELHIHHYSYEKGKRVWDIDPDELVTLCRPCHEETEMYVRAIRKIAPLLLTYRRRAKIDGGNKKVVELVLETIKSVYESWRPF